MRYNNGCAATPDLSTVYTQTPPRTPRLDTIATVLVTKDLKRSSLKDFPWSCEINILVELICALVLNHGMEVTGIVLL